MPPPIEQALSSLLPTLLPLPVELIDLATSLLAQSRSRTSTLKAEEEIGRTYACCHIACERLGKRLALEIGKPAPPVQPRVYAKLKTFLGSTLRTPSTPKGRGRMEDKLAPTSATPQRVKSVVSTPTSARRETRSSAKPTPTKSVATISVSGRKRKAEDEAEPMQVVRTVPAALLPDKEAEADFEMAGEDYSDDVAEAAMPVKRPSKTPLRRKEKHAKFDDGLEDVAAAGLLPGLGTMFQPAIDWLSDERRAEYAMWKEDIMRKMAVLDVERA
ncbi:hypothetical protein LTR08_006060 [Meristemomyces frigidus]|nr:hypothetical protein LTR08_006060 [Meristemomyces frigidus]